MINQKPCKYNPTIEVSEKRQKNKIANSAKSKNQNQTIIALKE